MKIVWFIYHNPNRRSRRRPILGIYLGQIYSKVHFLESDKLKDSSALLIRANIEELSMMEPQERMIWLRDRIDDFNKAYKTIHDKHVEILEEYEIKPIE